ncbi:hypothetical protein A9K55_005860 [Cordyceps militaris]|uniref:PD-(D/E)XK nuclease-like domain-containing protein n=1 Tax=Cordyceps militaris TaxID=73501 RepID=A0A2H4SE07_CORMI|nr:hypothetical protein A9K55_005860 [Cordyceps militaris]
MRPDEIQCWLDATHNHNNQETSLDRETLETSLDQENADDRATKRRRLNHLTPPSSCQEIAETGETKQHRLHHLMPPRSAAMDSPGATKRRTDDETPRAKRVQSSSDRSYSVSEQSSHTRSGRTSPLKQMLKLRHDPNGLDMRELESFADMPEDLDALLEDIQYFVDGKGIVSTSARAALADAAQSDKSFRWASASRDSDFLTDDPTMAGCTPLPEVVLDAKAAAFECSHRNHPEATWNLEYGNPTNSKKVDFCIYLEPENDATLSSEYRAAAERMRNALPQAVLNFTDFAPLDKRFIALSIETKKPSENVETGQLQLGVWEMARWKFLRRLAAGHADDDEGIFAAAAAAATRSARLPEFLPGIVTQGQEWYMVVTTAEGDRTVLWRKKFIGSTAGTRGIYQIVRTLQYLGRWVRDVYWPCVRSMLEQAVEG